MRDLIEMSYEISKAEKDPEKQRELFTEQFLKELLNMKSADIASHLSCTFDVVKREYNVMLSFPAVLDEADPNKSSVRVTGPNVQNKVDVDHFVRELAEKLQQALVGGGIEQRVEHQQNSNG